MNQLGVDLWSIISAYIDDESINELRLTSATLSNNINEMYNNTLFWKERTELLISKFITMDTKRVLNWKQIYKILLRYIGDNPPYEILPTFKEKDCIDAQDILKKYKHNRPDTNENIIAGIESEQYQFIEELLKIKPAIYNNSAFLKAIYNGVNLAMIIDFLDYGRVDIITIDQDKLFNTIVESEDDFNDIMLVILKKLGMMKNFSEQVLWYSLEYSYYDILNYLLDSRKLDISTINQENLYNSIMEREIDDEKENIDLCVKILRNFDTNQNFNNNTFLYFIENINENREIINWLLNNNKLNLSLIDSRVLFELLSKQDFDAEILSKILKNANIKFNGNIYDILSENTSKKFIELLLKDSRFNPRLLKKIPKYLLRDDTKFIIKEILQKFNTNDKFNNDTFLYYLSDNNTKMVNWLFKSGRVNLSIIDNGRLFRLLSKYNNVNILRDILKISTLNFNLGEIYEIYNILDPLTSSKFVELLLRDPRFDPSIIEDIPNFLNKNNAEIFLSDPRVNLSLSYLGGKDEVIKEYIKDSLSGLVVMHYLYNKGTDIYKPRQLVWDGEKFYYKFLKYLVVKKPTLIDAIRWLTKTTQLLGRDVNQNIINAAKSVLNNATNSQNLYSEPLLRTNLGNANANLYYIYKSFFLLSFKPRFTYKEILNILEIEGASPVALGMAAKIIGAKLGLNELIKDGLILTNELQQKLDMEITKNISDLDYTSSTISYTSSNLGYRPPWR
jgi:hypothetical protein